MKVIKEEELQGYLEFEPIISRLNITSEKSISEKILSQQLHIRPDAILEINPYTIIVFECVDRADQRALGELLTDKFFLSKNPRYKDKKINLCLIYKQMPDGFEQVFNAYKIITYKV